MTLKMILQSLEPGDKKRLMDAFDNCFTEVVEYAPKRFIGVHIQNNPNLKIDTSVGVWSAGQIT